MSINMGALGELAWQMNVLWQIYEKLFFSVEKHIHFHLTAPPKVTFPVYKTWAICRTRENVKRSWRKNVSRGLEQSGSKVETEMWFMENKVSSFIYGSLLSPWMTSCSDNVGSFFQFASEEILQLRLFHFMSCHIPSCQEYLQVERAVCKHLFTETTGKPAPEESPPTALCFNSSYS